MEWCRLHAGYYDDPALVRAGDDAELLFVRLLSYCAGNETGGRVPRGVTERLTPKRAAARVTALLREGLLLVDGDDLIVRSWSRLQETHDTEAVRRRKARDKKAQQRAAHRTAATVSPPVSPTCPPVVPDVSPGQSPGHQRGTVPGTSPSGPRHIEVEVEEEKEQELGTTSLVGRRKRATPAPDTFEITDTLRAWGREHAPLVTDPEVETRQFLDHHRAKGSLMKDWNAAWRTWMGNAQRYATNAAGARSGRAPFAVGYGETSRTEPTRAMTGSEWAAQPRSSA